MKLWSETLGGNLHQAAITINEPSFWIKWEHIAAMSFTGGYHTSVVFEVTEEEYTKQRAAQLARCDAVKAAEVVFGKATEEGM